MTDEAHAKAVEAAYLAYDTRNYDPMEDAITAYLATMAEAGWVMVRDVCEGGAILPDAGRCGSA